MTVWNVELGVVKGIEVVPGRLVVSEEGAGSTLIPPTLIGVAEPPGQFSVTMRVVGPVG
jgi:hypothetical protein